MITPAALTTASTTAPSLAVTALVARLIQFCGGLRPRQVKGDEGIQARFRQHRLFL